MKLRIILIGVIALIIAIGGWLVLKPNIASEKAETPSISTTKEDGNAEESSLDSSKVSNPEETPETTQQNEPSQNTTHTVTYSDGKFSPSPLEIKVGDTVLFKNESSGKMWVASDPHPAHTDYSAFDSKKGVSKGETYLFTFTEAGDYDYHNHMGGFDGGTITVI